MITTRHSCCPSVRSIIKIVPIESICFFGAALVAYPFVPALTAPLVGIGLGILITKLALKVFNRYNSGAMIYLTRAICKLEAKLNNKYISIQIIAILFALTIGFVSTQLALLVGGVFGSIGAILFDVKEIKHMQRLNRMKR